VCGVFCTLKNVPNWGLEVLLMEIQNPNGSEPLSRIRFQIRSNHSDRAPKDEEKILTKTYEIAM